MRGIYTEDESDKGNNCGKPYVIMENFLKYVLTVKTIFADVGDAYFQFAYGDGLYSINNNHCDCVGEAQGPSAVFSYCKCAFPVNGKSHKREIEFMA